MANHTEESEFFARKGFPYPVKGADQMFSTVASAGDQTAVVVKVQDAKKETEYRYYVGYYPPIQATNKAVDVRRVRKYKVVHVGQFRGSPLASSLTEETGRLEARRRGW